MERPRLKPTARGLFLALAGSVFVAAALVFERSDALLAGSTLIGAVAASALCARFARPPASFVRTMTSGTLAPGSSVEVRLTPVPASGYVPAADCVRDLTPWLEAEVRADRSGAALGYGFIAPGRGAYSVGPARITVPGPLGLTETTRLTAPAAELLVAPELVEVAVIAPDAESDLPQARSQAGQERVTEPAAVRDYQSGDPRRLVHWKATARRDRLMVREVVARGLPQTWVLVDDLAAAGAGAEAALSLSASAALRLLRQSHTVHLVFLGAGAGGDASFEPAGGAAPLLEAFARVRLRGGSNAGAGRGTGSQSSQAGPGPVGPGRLSQRILAQVGARGAVAPIYAALAEADDQRLAELGRLAVIARPGQLWLAGRAKTASGALRAQGWIVTVAP
ncbi:MAG: DUF58 domain-containing protein [Bifidobacteriaceae bacterium]|jgi:uncharacterized protein (DUF58 family)|nr:DUF58 domain-containing protein [Bifidobacteriaceae bacterium]